MACDKCKNSELLMYSHQQMDAHVFSSPQRHRVLTVARGTEHVWFWHADC